MHMVWVDEHNRLARELEKLSNNKNDEVIQLLQDMSLTFFLQIIQFKFKTNLRKMIALSKNKLYGMIPFMVKLEIFVTLELPCIISIV